MKTMKGYHDLYLKFKILLLAADVFGKIRNRCLENYGFRLTHCLSAPALSWGARLSMNKVWLIEIWKDDPKELHELKNDYPFAPDKLEIK